MDTIFIKLLNMSITAGYIILAVVVFRLLLKKAPKWVNCLLWGMVGIRLVLPFSIKSIFSLIPKNEAVSANILQTYLPAVGNGAVVNNAVSGISEYSGNVTENLIQSLIHTATIIWIVGMAVLIIYGIISYTILRNKVAGSESLGKNVYSSKTIVSPFILGVIKPKIYLPYNIKDENISHVIDHEEVHLKRKDHWIKPLSFLLLSVYWFNPLVWVAYILLSRDIELACDEAVIRKLGDKQKKSYSEALLDCSIGRRSITACPLAFGEVGVKGRIRNVLNYKKPAFWIILIAVIVSILVAAAFLTNPKNDIAIEMPIGTYEFESVIYINPLSSYYPFDDTGELYKITEKELVIESKETGEILNKISYDNVKASNFTIKEWEDLFIFDLNKTDISRIDKNSRMMWKLSDEFRIYSMDGEVWLMKLMGSNGVWSIYKLISEDKVVETQNDVEPEYWNPLINSDSLEKVIPHAIFIANSSNFNSGEYATSAYTILKKEDNENELVLYIMAMYMEFNYSNGHLIESGGTHSPIVITLEKGDNGGYGLEEYWIPNDGAGYAVSIKVKFPDSINEDLLNPQKFVTEHIRTCYESAIIQSGMEVDSYIERMFEEIYSSPLNSSNPYDYIKEHNGEYKKLLNYGIHTMQYCFTKFEKGGQTGLEGHIMALVCREILMGTAPLDSDLNYATGQEWYDELDAMISETYSNVH